MTLETIGKNAKNAARVLNRIDSNTKNVALTLIAQRLVENTPDIVKANEIDLVNARNKGIGSAMLDRLTLTADRIKSIADGVLKVRDLPDPIGETVSMEKHANGMMIGKRRVPLGVIGIIYESRPNVTVDTAVLCLKSSNAVILRGGSEAINSNMKIAEIMKNAVAETGLPEGTIELIEDTSRETATEMMRLNEYIDVLIPRGGAGLINSVIKNASVPVIQTGVGNCHVYVDRYADVDMAVNIVINAKVSRPSVCNAAETLLIDENLPDEFYQKMEDAFIKNGVTIRGCEKTLEKMTSAEKIMQSDYESEFLDYIIAVKTVKDIDDAIDHIDKYGTKHSECIVTTNYGNANKFLDEVDAAAVYVNASTRFTDGFEFGFGAEIGISTQKMHARGPMGLKELTTYKYTVYGNGQIR